METTNEYDKQAQEFLTKTNTSYKCTYLKYDKHFSNDEQSRNIYRITLEKNGKKYTTNFGDSLVNIKISTIKPYDFLACLQKYPISNIDEFVKDFGYTLNTKISEINRAYKACVREYTALKSLYSEDELELLRAIC